MTISKPEKYCEKTPEELDELRRRVETWLHKARDGVQSFHRKTSDEFHNTYRRDSKEGSETSFSSTTTARCYMGLVYAEQVAGSKGSKAEDWPAALKDFVEKYALDCGDEFDEEYDNTIQNKNLNNFEIAHLADLIFAQDFAQRFPKNTKTSKPSNKMKVPLHEKIETIKNRLQKQINCDDDEIIQDGQITFDKGKSASKHFFVTLHTLRALEILAATPKPKDIERIVKSAKTFCIEQCFYNHQNMSHFQDPARLVFASLIYCIYGEEVDQEIITAAVKAARSMQEASGKWPNSYPITRTKQSELEGKEISTPWYIASAELALSFTWLYFQPKLPDEARTIVLEILQKHFEDWIIPTYKTDRRFSGWSDDGAVSENNVVGWTTGIVCHFLANYISVLNDHINRTVIESLGLQDTTQRYLIDQTQINPNKKWARSEYNWPDLPPIAWQTGHCDPDSVKKDIIWNWSDPSLGSQLSSKLAKHVICPIIRGPSQKPQAFAAGILGGPPGTRKTSLIKTVSKILNWPYVPVPASVIFEQGFDRMEAQASMVFRRLNYLTQCVIFFDEFEEFVRDRHLAEESQNNNPEKDDVEESPGTRPEPSRQKNGKTVPKDVSTIHNRTAAAFLTSAMLPRFQDLRDKSQSLVFLATNSSDRIDPAIKRTGRFDFEEIIDYPKVSKFDGTDGGYFSQAFCGRFGLNELGISTPAISKLSKSDKKKLTEIDSEIKNLLNKQDVKEAIESVQDELKRQGSDIPKKNSVNRIKFSAIEKTAKCLSRSNNSEASKVLLVEINKIKNSVGSPGPLPDV